MIPSRDIYNRIVWDPRIDAGAFVMGYQDRVAPEGTVETPLAAWDPDGDVPWHRVRYFRVGDEIVWDRDLHIDLFSAEALPAAAWTEGVERVAERPSPQAVRIGRDAREALLSAEPTYRSAVVIVPPESLWPAINTLRRAHDRNVDRWMPHVTLLYGFVPDALFGDASRLAASALSKIRPFGVTLDGYGTFKGRASCTAYLRPVADPSDAIHRLQGALRGLFPQCDEQTSRPSGFVPHVSVGQFRSPADALRELPEWTPLRFTVASVAFISRDEEGPFDVRHEVPLGG